MKSDAELKAHDPELYRIARLGGTEPAGSSELLHVDPEGVFRCAVCNALLFSGETMFDSGTGWPSFTDPVAKSAVRLIADANEKMRRVEVQCATCKAHLGHVFPDGPERTGDGPRDFGRHNRYCINGISLSHQIS